MCVCVHIGLFVHTHSAFIGSIEASSPYSLYAITSERRSECLYMIVSGYRVQLAVMCVCVCEREG